MLPLRKNRMPLMVVAILCGIVTLSSMMQNNSPLFQANTPEKIRSMTTGIGNGESTTLQPPTPQFSGQILSWWNETYQYRRSVNITEPGITDRSEPVNVFMTFPAGTHHKYSTRVIKYEGENNWVETPCQVWNRTFSGDFITAATITFKADVLAGSVSQYYIYYTNTIVENKTKTYLQDSVLKSMEIWKPGGLEPDFINSVGITNGMFDLTINKSAGYSSLSKNGINYHTTYSMAPGPGSLVTDGLIGYWDFNEGSGTVANDKTGNGYTGTLYGNPTWTTGKDQSALLFSGSQYVSVSIPRGDTVTFSLWATWTGATNKMLFNAGPSGAGPDLFFENALGTGRVAWNTWDSWTNSFGTIPASSANGQFHHYVVVVNKTANNVKLFYDGALLGTAVYKDPSPGSPPNSNIFKIGGGAGYYWTGKIDEIKLYDRALTIPEIQILYNFKSNSTIESIKMLQNGPIFKQYQLNWSKANDLRTQDIVTVYSNMDRYSVTRSFHFDSIRNPSNNSWTVFNTQYDATKFYQPTSFGRYHYDFNNQPLYTITSPFTAQNYSVIRAPITSTGPWTSIGVYLTGFSRGSDTISFSSLKWAGTLIDNQFQFVPGNWSNLYQPNKPLPLS